ncbi:MAG: hypothetical protein LBV32_08935 [Tannerellaceae bacterium]|nr:hypothetical protein [Tannerellaceae bacterium]
MKPQLELIKKSGENGNEYWTSRDLCGALGYTTYYKFVSVINKAMKVVQEKGMDMNNHFYLTVEMVQVGSGAYRKVDNYHLGQIYESGELKEEATIRKIQIVQQEGERD